MKSQQTIEILLLHLEHDLVKQIQIFLFQLLSWKLLRSDFLYRFAWAQVARSYYYQNIVHPFKNMSEH